MDSKLLKKQLNEKVGKFDVIDDNLILVNKVDYISGIEIFDEYLKTNNLGSGVIKIEKRPLGFAILIAKNFSSVPFGITHEEIDHIKIHNEHLVLVKTDKNNIFLEIKNDDNLYYIERFFASYLQNDEHELQNKIELNLSNKTDVTTTENNHLSIEDNISDKMNDITSPSYIAILSSVIIAIGCFLPWLQLGVVFKNNGIDNPIGAPLLILSVICIALGALNIHRKTDKYHIAFILGGILGTIIFYSVFSEASTRAKAAANAFNNVKEAIGDNPNLSNNDFIGAGLYVVLLGSLGLILAGTKVLKL